MTHRPSAQPQPKATAHSPKLKAGGYVSLRGEGGKPGYAPNVLLDTGHRFRKGCFWARLGWIVLDKAVLILAAIIVLTLMSLLDVSYYCVVDKLKGVETLSIN